MLPSYMDLVHYKRFIRNFNHGPSAFEYLIASGISQIFHLPFRTSRGASKNAVTWHGSILSLNQVSKSPSGPDITCCGFGFNVLIETTTRTGKNIWRKEFLECLRHYDNFVKRRRIPRKDVFLILVAPKLHENLFVGFKQESSKYNLILLSRPWLISIWKTTLMVPTIKHIDLLCFLTQMVDKLRSASSFGRFLNSVEEKIKGWQNDILTAEEKVFFALRAYEALLKVGSKVVSISEICSNLRRDNVFNQYWDIIGRPDLTAHLPECVILERMAVKVPIPDGEGHFCKVEVPDYRERCKRLIKSVEEIGG